MSGVDYEPGRRHGKRQERERKGQHAERAPAKEQQDGAGEYWNLRADLDRQNVLGAANNHQRQAQDQNHPSDYRGGRNRDIPQSVSALPRDPGGRQHNQRSVAFLLGLPRPLGQREVGWNVGRHYGAKDQQARRRDLAGNRPDHATVEHDLRISHDTPLVPLEASTTVCQVQTNPAMTNYR